MEKNSFINLVVAQLSGLHATALSELGTSHALTFTLGQALTAAKGSLDADVAEVLGTDYIGLLADAEAQAKPAVEFVNDLPRVQDVLADARSGSDCEDGCCDENEDGYGYGDDYDEGDNLTPVEVTANLPLNVQVEATEGVTDEETEDALETVRNSTPVTTGYANEDGEVVDVPTADVYAQVPTADGGVVTIGNRENIDRIQEMFADREDAEDGEGQEPQIVINYRRLDGNEFTREDLDKVINSRVSQGGLTMLGARAMWNAEQGEDKSAFRTVWFVAEGEIPLAAIRANCAKYQGSHPFPGVGLVEAKASPYEA